MLEESLSLTVEDDNKRIDDMYNTSHLDKYSDSDIVRTKVIRKNGKVIEVPITKKEYIDESNNAILFWKNRRDDNIERLKNKISSQKRVLALLNKLNIAVPIITLLGIVILSVTK